MSIKKNITPHSLEIVFESDLAHLESIVNDTVEFITDHCDIEDLFALKLILFEGLTNAVKHGNKFDVEKEVTHSVVFKDELLDITITDQGDGFDWSAVVEKEEQDVTIPSGRGLILFKEYGFNPTYSNGGRTLNLSKIISNS